MVQRGPWRGGGNTNFPTPLRKEDLLLSLNVDFGRVRLEVRINEKMSPPKRGLRRNVSAAGMEILGLGTDWLIGQEGCVDLTSLLLGMWEEVWWENDWQRWTSMMTAGGGGSRRRMSAGDDGDGGGGRRRWEAASLKVRVIYSLLYPTTLSII